MNNVIGVTRQALRGMTRSVLLLAGLFAGVTGAGAAQFELSGGRDVVGSVRIIEARYEDTFVRLARRYNVGYEELRRANPDVDPWLPGEGTEIVLPTQFVLPRAERSGIVINVPELRLYYFPDDETVITHPISIGRQDWRTPLGRTSVVAKTENPAWYPPQSIRDEHAARNDFLPAVVPPGPDNPLGDFALRLGIPGYLIHGTNMPAGVGMRVTHGCIRMFPEDIEALFPVVALGVPVQLVNQPFKFGWGEEGLYLEAHPPLDEEFTAGQWSATDLTRAYIEVTEERGAQLDWRSAERVMEAARGVPQAVASAAAGDDGAVARAH